MPTILVSPEPSLAQGPPFGSVSQFDPGGIQAPLFLLLLSPLNIGANRTSGWCDWSLPLSWGHGHSKNRVSQWALVLFHFLFWGHSHQCSGVATGSTLRKYSWQAQGTMWDAGDQTQISSVGVKCPPYPLCYHSNFQFHF